MQINLAGTKFMVRTVKKHVPYWIVLTPVRRFRKTDKFWLEQQGGRGQYVCRPDMPRLMTYNCDLDTLPAGHYRRRNVYKCPPAREGRYVFGPYMAYQNGVALTVSRCSDNDEIE